jgi:hypothetical protein
MLWIHLSYCPSLGLPGSFRGEDFFKQYSVANQKQELPLAAIFVGGTERNEETL